MTKKFSEYDATAVGFIMWYEDAQDGENAEDRIVAGFQSLVDTGLAWKLQGHYGRTAASLLQSGAITQVELKELKNG